MAYATEADYRAAITAYRAFHQAFYRFYKMVRAQPPPNNAIAATEDDHRRMVDDLLPALARSYAGPRHYVDRLAGTLRELGVVHASSPHTLFDAELTRQAYIDVDNILEDLLRTRAEYPAAFDEAFAGSDVDADH